MAATSPTQSQNGIAQFFWPDPVTEDGQINNSALVRRMETFLSLLIPSMAATTYGVLEYCCQYQHSGFTTFICFTPLPVIFATVDEYRVASEAARIQALKEDRLKSTQGAPIQLEIERKESRIGISPPVTAASTTTLPAPTSPPDSFTQPPRTILKNTAGVSSHIDTSPILTRRRVEIADPEDRYPTTNLPELSKSK